MKRAIAILLLAAASVGTIAQEGPFAPLAPPVRADESQAPLEQLLAPVALYPDALLAQVLIASTYPLEVVALHRWLEARAQLSGDALEQAVGAQPWDASVKALAPFRSVVAMMNGELDWMQRLGNAFLERQAEVMDAVQRLRRKAREAGSLADNARERVIVESGTIVIEPADPQVVYVPVYDPLVVYGPWWWPAYPPYAWATAYFGPWDYVYGGIYFGFGYPIGPRWHGDYHPDWHNHNFVPRHPGSTGVWRHDPQHRGGVPYLGPGSRERYNPLDRGRVRDRQDYRGFEVRPRPAPPSANPLARPPANPIARPPQAQRPSTGASPLAPAPRDNALQHSSRGRESLRPSPPPPSRPDSSPRPNR